LQNGAWKFKNATGNNGSGGKLTYNKDDDCLDLDSGSEPEPDSDAEDRNLKDSPFKSAAKKRRKSKGEAVASMEKVRHLQCYTHTCRVCRA
jgi:hypothetical protein